MTGIKTPLGVMDIPKDINNHLLPKVYEMVYRFELFKTKLKNKK